MKSLEELLALALEQRLSGTEPDPVLIAQGDQALAAELGRLLGHSAKLAVPAPTAKLPRVFGSYAIERELGRGGMGHVLLGEHRLLKRRAAIKILPRPYAYIEENRERFRREAQALAQVGHPGVVPIHEVGEQDGVPYAVLELIDGGSLEDLLAEVRGLDLLSARAVGITRLPGDGAYERRVADLIAQVADAVEAIHRAGILHRDIKPANLLLDPAHRRVLLSDFGLALQTGKGTITHAGAIVGTRQFLAPELTRADGKASPASDVFALGVTLYELLTLHAPFSGESEEGLYTQIRERDPDPPRKHNRHVSKDLETVCLRAVEKAPSNRYASAAEFAADLRAAARGEPIKADRRSGLRRTARRLWYRRRLVGVWTSVGLGVVLAAIVTWGAIERHRQHIEQEWVDNFHAGELFLLAGSGRFAKELNEPNCTEALRRFRRCTELRPDRGAAWLRRADMAARLNQKDEAACALASGEALGEHGWYARSLAAMIRGEAAPSLDGIKPGCAREVWEDWAPIDRLALAARLMNEKRYRDAWEIVADARLDAHPWFVVDALRGDYLLRNLDSSEPIYSERAFQNRLALDSFDRFLASHPESTLMALDRALVIRNAVTFNEELGANRDQLLASAIATVEAFHHASKSLYAMGLWIDMLFLANRNDEALDELVVLTADQRAELPFHVRVSAVKVLVREQRYDLAFEVLKTESMDQRFTGGGPLKRLAAVLQHVGSTETDLANVRAFADSVHAGVTAQDWSEAMDKLAEIDRDLKLKATAAPGSTGK